MDQRAKKQETRKQQKSCETREVPYTCKYINGYLIPNSVYTTKTDRERSLALLLFDPYQALNS